MYQYVPGPGTLSSNVSLAFDSIGAASFGGEPDHRLIQNLVAPNRSCHLRVTLQSPTTGFSRTGGRMEVFELFRVFGGSLGGGAFGSAPDFCLLGSQMDDAPFMLLRGIFGAGCCGGLIVCFCPSLAGGVCLPCFPAQAWGVFLPATGACGGAMTPFPRGTEMICPALTVLPRPGLAFLMASTVEPSFFAMLSRVSPFCTTYRVGSGSIVSSSSASRTFRLMGGDSPICPRPL